MTEHELELRLRDYYRLEVADDGAPGFLRSTVTAIPETVPASPFQGRRGLVLLIAAALLAALLVGTAIGVGTGLIDLSRTVNLLPSPSESAAPYALTAHTFTTAASIEGCNYSGEMPEGMVASLWTSVPVGSQGTGLKLFSVLDGGLVLIAPEDAPPEQAWIQRRLTEPGLNELLDALVQPDLPSCRPYNLGDATPRAFILSVQVSEGVYTMQLLPAGDPLEAHLTTPAQAATINDLLGRLQGPDLGLAPAAWADASWTPYVSQTWELAVDVTGDVGPGPLLTDALKLPDGTPLLQAGEADPTAQDRGVASARCAMVDSATANAVLAQLPPKAPGNAGSWDFANATVIVEPTLPGAQCPTQADVTPSPPQEPSTTAPSGTDVCAFLSADAAQQVLGDPKLATSSQTWTNAGLDGWSGCIYGSEYTSPGMGGPHDNRQGTLLLDLQAVPGDQAEALARGLFGSENTTAVEIAGHPVFSNGCDPQTDQFGCNPSVAISVEPDFLVLEWAGGSQDDLLALATALIQGAGSGPGG
jgi:hypothetical protein